MTKWNEKTWLFGIWKYLRKKIVNLINIISLKWHFRNLLSHKVCMLLSFTRLPKVTTYCKLKNMMTKQHFYFSSCIAAWEADNNNNQWERKNRSIIIDAVWDEKKTGWNQVHQMLRQKLNTSKYKNSFE